MPRTKTKPLYKVRRGGKEVKVGKGYDLCCEFHETGGPQSLTCRAESYPDWVAKVTKAYRALQKARGGAVMKLKTEVLVQVSRYLSSVQEEFMWRLEAVREEGEEDCYRISDGKESVYLDRIDLEVLYIELARELGK